ncbi:uncharacterized protein LOC122756574 [Drosophila santomea]|uniref:uncharacterized protein LOC122756574 n=1 Tax=Drosophila santomea TaxID=129105 RepID=UPI001CCEC646|nr:uncharacterized protein LOC122756574 [Drosophila santomea]
MSSDQKNERRSSVNPRNACYSYFSTRDIDQHQKATKSNSTLLTVYSKRASSCSPSLLTPTPASWSYQCQTPSPPASLNEAPTTSSAKISAANSPPIIKPTTNTASSVPTAAQQNKMATKTASLDKRQAVPAIQTGMDRYIQIKRKLSPPNTVGNKPKINRTNKSTDQTRSSNENRFSILADNNQPDSYCIEESPWKNPTNATALFNAQTAKSMDTPGHTAHFGRSA